jgi:hypothetical protein
VNIDLLAQAAKDALEAAEQRGFERALSFVQERLKSSPEGCIMISTRKDSDECYVHVAIEVDADADYWLLSEIRTLADIVRVQYPECKRSTEQLVAVAKTSLSRV